MFFILKQVCTLPRYERLVSCMSFHPTKSYLLVAYANRRIIEYDFEANEYTDWSRLNSDKFPKQWLKLHTKLSSCFYDLANPEKIITHDEQYLTVLNKIEPMPDYNEKIFQQQLAIKTKANNINEDSQDQDVKTHALHVSDKYRVSFRKLKRIQIINLIVVFILSILFTQASRCQDNF